MKRTIFYLFILAGLTLGTGCKKDNSPAKPPTTAELRIFNSTPWTFYSCTIDPTGTLSDNPGPNAYNFGQVDINAKQIIKPFPNCIGIRGLD